MDKISPDRRSENMRQIRSKGMRPEIAVRQLTYSLGYRYRLHSKDLPGKPDLVFRSRRKVIFVHGCFWHQHNDPECKIVRKPKSNNGYWNTKLETNSIRDAKHLTTLLNDNWKVLVIWECQIDDKDNLSQVIQQFLDAP